VGLSRPACGSGRTAANT